MFLEVQVTAHTRLEQITPPKTLTLIPEPNGSDNKCDRGDYWAVMVVLVLIVVIGPSFMLLLVVGGCSGGGEDSL